MEIEFHDFGILGGSLWRHYRAHRNYRVLWVGHDEATLEPVVIYTGVTPGAGNVMVRPLSSWFQLVDSKGSLVMRFAPVEDEAAEAAPAVHLIDLEKSLRASIGQDGDYCVRYGSPKELLGDSVSVVEVGADRQALRDSPEVVSVRWRLSRLDVFGPAHISLDNASMLKWAPWNEGEGGDNG